MLMRNNFDKERLLQIFIILIYPVVLIVQYSSASSSAQTSCLPNTPPITDTRNGWIQGTTVSVKIFDRADTNPTSQAEFDAIDGAIREWNNIKVSGCSNVTFETATRAGRAWVPDEAIPDNTMHVVRTSDRSGQLVHVYNILGQQRAARLYMHVNSSLNTRDPHHRVDNLAKHEAGHSFGIGNGNGQADPPSIYSENSLTGLNNNYAITECDIAAHKRV